MRATARSLAAEMHSGFAALRSEWSMKAALDGLAVPLSAEGQADLGRIDAIWRECRERHGARGPWLFGDRYTIADAMYAPVMLRCRTYGASLSPPSHAYYSHALNDPHLQEWIRAARDEIGLEGRPRDHA
jgi:glutathione S-transferase